MYTHDDTTTHPAIENDEDKILILDGKQRMEYLGIGNPPAKRRCLLGASVSKVLRKLRA